MTKSHESVSLGISLRCDVFSRSQFWQDLLQFYHLGHFCDLRIVCHDGEFQCHRLILASTSNLFYSILRGENGPTKRVRNHRRRRRTCPDEPVPEADGEVVVHLPDYPLLEVKEFVDKVYGFMAGTIDENVFQKDSEEMMQFFQFRVEPVQSGESIEEEKEEEEDNKEVVRMQIDPDFLPGDLNDVPDLDLNHLEPFSEQFPEDVEKVPKNKRKKRKSSVDDFIDDDHYGEEEMEEEFKPKKRGRKKKVKEEFMTSEEEDEDEENEVIYRQRNGEKLRIQGTPLFPKVKAEDEKDCEMSPDLTPQSLYLSMKASIDTLNVRILSEPLDVISHCNKKQRELSTFQALVGFIGNPNVPNEPLLARPVAWSFPTSGDITPQFDDTCKALRSLFGFSDSDMHYNGLLYSRQGLYRKNKSKKIRYDLKRRYAKLFREQLQGMLNGVDIQNAIRRYPRKPDINIESDSIRSLEMRPELAPEQFDGLLLVAWSRRFNAVVGRIFNCPGTDMDKESDDCMWALFDVWCIGQEKLRIPDSEYLRKKFNALMEPMETYRIVIEFEKEDPDGKQREQMLSKEKQCSECGKVFPCVTVQDEFKLTAHKKNHYYENFVCDCPESASFPSLAAKRNHVKLKHSDGRYVKCDHCSYVSTEASVRNHCEREHNKTCVHSCVCETCGKVLNDSKALYMHMLIHKSYKCKLCGHEVIGYSAFNTHKKNFHPSMPQTFPCEVCGKEFPERVKLKNHFLRIHVEDKDRPYQCSDCGRGFAVSRALSAHRMMAHIKTRPYQCRYGCGAAYNDHSSRGTHERKKHGGRFPVEKMKPKI